MKLSSVLVFCMAFFLVACSRFGKPDGRDAVENAINKNSNGLIELVSYTKTNGIERDLFGSKAYVVEYQAEIQFTDDAAWTGGRNAFASLFAAVKEQGACQGRQDFAVSMCKMSMGFNYPVHTKKGQQFNVEGTVTYEMTDNGYRVTNVE